MKNIPLFKVYTDVEAARVAVEAVLASGFIGQGPRVEEFEKILRGHFSSPWVNTVNSCTSGLQLAVHMEKEDVGAWKSTEVLTTPLTCTATNFAILAEGLDLRWVDVDPRTGNMDLDDLARKVGPNTFAIMLVHWGGYPCDLDLVRDIQCETERRYGFAPPVIEDCAHAWGATYKNRLVGTHGNTSVFSFQAIKHLTTGDGGCMISPDQEHYRRAKLLRWYGLDRDSSADFRCRQNIREWGFKFNMNDVAAGIGIANYPRVGELVERHRSNGACYNRELAGVPGVTLMECKGDRQSSFWVYTLRVKDRDGFTRKMAENGITTSPVHARNDRHDCLRVYRTELPGLDVLSEQITCLPCGWWVTEEDRERIVRCVRGGW